MKDSSPLLGPINRYTHKGKARKKNGQPYDWHKSRNNPTVQSVFSVATS
jgi:hypothetical protein